LDFVARTGDFVALVLSNRDAVDFVGLPSSILFQSPVSLASKASAYMRSRGSVDVIYEDFVTSPARVKEGVRASPYSFRWKAVSTN
jgi:hypothetical protein